jgi:GntR family phosphonate transport system transcriptional regulator
VARLVIFGEPHDPRKWVRVANGISARIAYGRYPPGERVPALPVISAELSVSYPTAMKAMHAVREQGLVSKAGTNGFYVGNGPPPPSRQGG